MRQLWRYFYAFKEVIKLSKAYYGSRFSPNMTKTPQGYLVCHNVPIGRTGWQEYLSDEVKGMSGNQPAQLYRSPEEVFNPASIASWEKMPVTDEHPPDWLTPDNVNAYMRGVVSNVRQGLDQESDLLLADLIIYDPILISEINAGKREVSGGYDYDCVPLEGQENKFAQTNIRGNHVAIVREGRAGHRVAVKDQKPKKEGMKRMPKSNSDTIWGKMFKAFAQDAEPEELAEASKMMHKETSKDEEPAEIPAVADKKAEDAEPVAGEGSAAEAVLKHILEKIDDIGNRLTALEQSDKEVHANIPKPKDALDELVSELGGGDEGMSEGVTGNDPDDESSVTIAPEQLQDGVPVASPEDRPKNPIPGADSRAAVRMAINAIKPVVASIQDPKQRKAACDKLAKTFREQLQIEKAPTDAYSKMAKAPKPKATDSKDDDPSKLGEDLKYKYNPHYKGKRGNE